MSEPARIFHVVTVVWGRPYIDVFLNVAVPNQMTPGNLGALPPGSRYRVFTSPEDAEALAENPALRRVNELMPVDVVVMPELSDSTIEALIRTTAGNRRALVDARKAQAGLLFLNADFFMSEGAMAAMMRHHAAGSRAVAGQGIRLNKDTFVAGLEERGGIRSVKPRDLASLALQHLHPFTHAHLIDAAQTACSPISVYWNVSDEGILARAFFLQPLMVDPVHRDVMPKGTVDAKYLIGACPAREQIHVVSDSDELCFFELSDVDAAAVPLRAGGISRWRAATLLSACDAHGWFYWTVPIRVHARDLGPAWASVEAQSARFAAQTARLGLVFWWMLFAAHRLKPVQRQVGALKKRLRRVVRRVPSQQIRRSVVLAMRRGPKVRARAQRATRLAVRRAVRSAVLLGHSTARGVHKFRKQAVRAGRRVLVR